MKNTNTSCAHCYREAIYQLSQVPQFCTRIGKNAISILLQVINEFEPKLSSTTEPEDTVCLGWSMESIPTRYASLELLMEHNLLGFGDITITTNHPSLYVEGEEEPYDTGAPVVMVSVCLFGKTFFDIVDRLWEPYADRLWAQHQADHRLQQEQDTLLVDVYEL